MDHQISMSVRSPDVKQKSIKTNMKMHKKLTADKLDPNPLESLKQMKSDGINLEQEMTPEEFEKMKDTWGSEYKKATKRFTSHCPIEVQERLRNMCFWTRVPISDYFVYGLVKVLEEFESQFNNGSPWKQRPTELLSGRPAGR